MISSLCTRSQRFCQCSALAVLFTLMLVNVIHCNGHQTVNIRPAYVDKLCKIIDNSLTQCPDLLYIQEDLICYGSNVSSPNVLGSIDEKGDRRKNKLDVLSMIQSVEISTCEKWQAVSFTQLNGRKCIEVHRWNKMGATTRDSVNKTALGDTLKAQHNLNTDPICVETLKPVKYVYCFSLHKACKAGKLDVVKCILTRVLRELNCRDKHGRTPVMAAAIKGQWTIFDFLMGQSPDLTVVDHYLDSVIHLACMGGNINIVGKLLEKHINIESRGFGDWTPVMNAARYGYEDIFNLLEASGCNVKVIDEDKRNILHVACMGGNVDIVSYILSRNICSTESREHKGKTPVMIAAENGHVEAVKLLVSKHCDLGMLDNRKNNILHLACAGGHVDVVRYILSKNPSIINNRGSVGRTPLMLAAQKGHLDVLKLLLRKGSSLSDQDDYQNNIVHIACTGGDMRVVTYILSQNISGPECKGYKGRTPVMMAALKGHRRVIELLVSKGCNVSAVDEDMNSLLHHACRRGHADIVKYLLTLRKVSKNTRNRFGRTPVEMAKQKNYFTIVSLLNAIEKAGKAAVPD